MENFKITIFGNSQFRIHPTSGRRINTGSVLPIIGALPLRRMLSAPTVVGVKRPRVYAAPSRPVDKEVFCIIQDANTAATSATIHVSAVAETFSGGVIRGSFVSGGVSGTMSWALQYIAEGYQATDITPANGTRWEPEQTILASGILGNNSTVAGNINIPIMEKIKTQRKMEKGDAILFVTDATANGCANVTVVCSLFFKQ